MKADEMYIEDILYQAEFIQETVPKITKDELGENMLYQNALIREMAQTRDKLIHGYSDINFDKLWMIVSVDIPNLVAQINEIQ